MSHQNDSRERAIDTLRAEMPPVAEEEALRRVREGAIKRHTARRASVLSRYPWRKVGVMAAAAVVIAVVALSLAPRTSTTAFGREAAADALLLQTEGRVLHVVVHYTETSSNDREGHDPRQDIEQRWSAWIDPDRQRMREEYVNVGDGSLDNLRVQVGGRVMTFQNNVRYGTGDVQQLIDEGASGEPVSSWMGGMIDSLRARIADGSAKATGTEIIDGEEYWVVEYEAPLDGPLTSRILTATMRTSDYRIRAWTWEAKTLNGDGRGTQTSSGTFEVIEQLEPDMLPDDFFSFDAVTAAAEPGTPVEKR